MKRAFASPVDGVCCVAVALLAMLAPSAVSQEAVSQEEEAAAAPAANIVGYSFFVNALGKLKAGPVGWTTANPAVGKYTVVSPGGMPDMEVCPAVATTANYVAQTTAPIQPLFITVNAVYNLTTKINTFTIYIWDFKGRLIDWDFSLVIVSSAGAAGISCK